MSIPLTFDWLTVAFIRVRLHALAAEWRRGGWKRARALPRQLALLAILSVFSGCVPATRFEEAQSAAQVEAESHRRAELQLTQLKAENEQLRSQMQAQGHTLDERDQALSQAELDSSVQGKQRQDAEGMVEQLRGELARVGGHLQAYHDDKQKLEAALEAQAAQGRELARISRDVTASLAEPIGAGEYGLDAERDRIVLRAPRDKLLAADGGVSPDAVPVLKAVARVMKLHPQSKLRVEDSSAAADAVATSKLVAALGELGMAADRFEPLAVDVASATAAPASDAAEISFGFSVP
ncbi:MAG TPA: hypothetical protein VHB79_24565 [Polyangiaceae bacterium]|nr:hypothetical protein [Polyangiaceae bacterium]